MFRHLIPPDSKHSSYRGRYRVGDNPRIYEVTLHTNVKEVAEKLLNEIHKDAQREAAGLIPASFTRKAQRRPIDELLAEFLKAVGGRGRSADYVKMLRIRIGIVSRGCGWKTAADITKPSFLAWRDRQTEYEPRTLNHFFDSVRVFCNWLDRTFEIPNPLQRVDKLPVPVKHPEGPRAFTEDELRRLFATVKPQRLLQYRLLTFTGLRTNELRQLCWGDLHLGEPPGLQLRAHTTKAKRGDWLPLLPVIVDELKEYRPETWRPNMRVLRRGIADHLTLHGDLKRADIPLVDHLGRRVGFHTFRRTFISQLQRQGVHSRVVMQLARHKSLRLTDWTYTDTTQLPLAAGVQTLAGLAAAGAPSPAPRKSGQTGVVVSNADFSKNGGSDSQAAQAEDKSRELPVLSEAVQDLDWCGQRESNPLLMLGKHT